MPGNTVWLASYPKSGNTWFRIVHESLRSERQVDINQLSDGPQAADPVVFEHALCLPIHLFTKEEVQLLRPRVDEVVARESTDLVFRKIHDALYIGPAGELIVSVGATRAAIYIVRDPRDVAVSLAHHLNTSTASACRVLCGDEGSYVAFLDESRSPWQVVGMPTVPQFVGDWSGHVRSWVDDAPFDVYPVRYEDCVSDPVASFGAAFRSVGLTFTRDDLGRAVRTSSFEQLQAQESERGFEERVGRTPFFRQGRSGAWQTELPPDQAALIVERHAEVMGRFGYI